MKNFKNLAWCLLAMLSVMSCKKEDTPALVSVSSIRVTVKNPTGETEPQVQVYLFEAPSTEPNGTSPNRALKRATTNEVGTANLNLHDLPAFPAGTVLYATAMEQLLTKEQRVLGSTQIIIENTSTIEEELRITDRSLKYKHGFQQNIITSELAINEYNRWKTTQVVTCGDGLRVIASPSNQTLVEAVGFGTLLAAYANDKPTFDGLMRFYNSKRTPESQNMMGWKVTCDGILDPGSATDGDLDVAFALIVASKQWDDPSYLNAAREILQIIKTNLLFECNVNGRNVLIIGPGYAGRAWGGCDMMNIMYHSPAFFRVFAQVTGDNTWLTLAEDTYTVLNAGAHPTTGLVPDWQTATGIPGPGGRVGYFGYDACRAPWRLTLDYLWNGNQQAKDWSVKVSNWAQKIGPRNIVDGYELNGTPRGTNGLNSSFLGGFAVATMSNSQPMVNSFSTELSPLRDSFWFNLNTRVLYLFTLTGNFWDPMER